MKYFIITSILAAFCSLFASAQTGSIKGTVTESTANEPLYGATVELQRNDSTISVTTTDFEDASFSFAGIEAGAYSLKVRFIGYNEQTEKELVLQAGQTLVVNIQLDEPQEIMECVVVTTSKRLPMSMSRKRSAIPSTPRIQGENNINTNGYLMGLMDEKTTPETAENYNQEAGPITPKVAKDTVIENEPVLTETEAFSTFSIDVDKANYAYIRYQIKQDNDLDKNNIRIEEMINYFTYDYPQPTDEHPFSVFTELSDCPWNKEAKLLHIGLQGKDVEWENTPATNFVFLIDVSGSMSEELPLIKTALNMFVDKMRRQDRVSIVVYAGAAGVVLPSTSGANRSLIRTALSRLRSGGSTAGGEGILLAYKIAQKNLVEGGNNRVILATDGDFNVGVSAGGELENLIVQEREKGIFLTVLGLGDGNYRDKEMEILADKGNGNYFYLDSEEEAKKVLIREMGGTLYTIAKDVKLQLEFNKSVVKSYRLVGYENRILAKEDFEDDKKDAGELGAGHTVTALYEIITTENTTAEDKLMQLSLRYKQPDATESKLLSYEVKNNYISLDKASDNLGWAAAVAGWGQLLRDSKYKGSFNEKAVLELAKAHKSKDKDGERAEFIGLVAKK